MHGGPRTRQKPRRSSHTHQPGTERASQPHACTTERIQETNETDRKFQKPNNKLLLTQKALLTRNQQHETKPQATRQLTCKPGAACSKAPAMKSCRRREKPVHHVGHSGKERERKTTTILLSDSFTQAAPNDTPFQIEFCSEKESKLTFQHSERNTKERLLTRVIICRSVHRSYREEWYVC